MTCLTTQRSAFKCLADLTETGYVLFRENGRLGVLRRDVRHGASYEMALLTRPLEYRSSVRGKAMSRDQLLDQTPIPEEELHLAEICLSAISDVVGDELTQLMDWGWEFPDDGRVSFQKEAGLGAASDMMVLKAYLDNKDHVVYELGGSQVSPEEAVAWLKEVEGHRAEREAALLADLLQKLKDSE